MYRNLFILGILLTLIPGFGWTRGIQIRKDTIYVDGEVFLVKGLGYSSFHPYESPPRAFVNINRRKQEFNIIRKAGFNTIRTWIPLTLEELNLAHENGLLVIQGVWIEYRQTYTDPKNIMAIINYVRPHYNESSLAPNVLLFLLGNEPQPRHVFSVGRNETDKFFIRLKSSLKENNLEISTSISNWVQADFLNDSMWDMAALNLYPYNPQTVSHATGFRGYVDWMKRERAAKRPFIITETGLSVSKSGQGNLGYGGNTIEQQKEGVLQMYHAGFSGGANGVCVFEFIDEWWKNQNHANDQKKHELTDAEEWFGIAFYDEDGYLHKRPVFHALREYNQALIHSPKDEAIISKNTPIEVYVEEDIRSVSFKLDYADEWINLKRKSKHWFKGKISIKKQNIGKHTLHLKSTGPDPDDLRNEDKEKEYFKIQSLYINKKNKLKGPNRVEIILDRDTYYTANKIMALRFGFKVVNGEGKPVPNTEIAIAIYEPVLEQKLKFIKKTDSDGYTEHVYHVNEEGIITVSAGVLAFPKDAEPLSKDNGTLRYKKGDVKHIQVFYEDPNKKTEDTPRPSTLPA